MVPGSASLEVAKGPQVGELGATVDADASAAPGPAAAMTSEELKKALEDIGCEDFNGRDHFGDDVDSMYWLLFTDCDDHSKIIDALNAEEKREVLDDMTKVVRLADRDAMNDMIMRNRDLDMILAKYRNTETCYYNTEGQYCINPAAEGSAYCLGPHRYGVA